MDRRLIESSGRRLRLRRVGDGGVSVIVRRAPVARRADSHCDIAAGVLSINPANAFRSGRQKLLQPGRIYADWRAMPVAEATRPGRTDAVVIATPPRLRHSGAKAFLERGFDVICGRSLTHDVTEARNLDETVKRTGRLLCLTHRYAGYPMIRQAQAMTTRGAVGKRRMIEGEFNPGTPGVALEPLDPAKRHWRFRADQAGKGGLLGENGSHIHHLIKHATGLNAEQVPYLKTCYAERREVDANAHLTAKFGADIHSMIWNSHVAARSNHGQTIKVCTKPACSRGGRKKARFSGTGAWAALASASPVAKTACRKAQASHRPRHSFRHCSTSKMG